MENVLIIVTEIEKLLYAKQEGISQEAPVSL